ncbi:hypothetical protein C9994_00450 [Marivirga lumbricoides]|uniref:Uncharacterized protein n=1 Tax=Marivirga lumbricoides TaxID=1046115 RepID=A0A2T4DVV2_9BACT|nr:hypothetical protein C9994_00450 [Marivirga lumbricoides]
MKNYLLLITILALITGCSEQKKAEIASETENETIETSGFNPESSDPEAVDLADKVIAAHGGTEAWNEKRYISWNFLGVRDLVWDKYTGLVRIDFPRAETQYIVNINEDSGRVKVKNELITDQDSLQKMITQAEQIWVNDSYWLVFPFKLKDPGVRLKYIGSDTTLAGEKAEVIALQFDSVGYTPQNKYMAYINPETYLIMQWDYYQNASDSTAAFQQLWSDYKDFDGIKLAAGRADRRLENIKVSNEIDTAVFEQF